MPSFLFYGALVFAGALLYLFSRRKNQQSSKVIDEFYEAEEKKDIEHEGKVKVYETETHLPTDDHPLHIRSKKLKRIFNAAASGLVLSFIPVQQSVRTFVFSIEYVRLNYASLLSTAIPYFVMGITLLYQLFLMTRSVRLYRTFVVLNDIFGSVKIQYNELRILQSFDSERVRAGRSDGHNDFRYFSEWSRFSDFNRKVLTYYFIGKNNVSKKLSVRQYNFLEKKVTEFKEHLVWRQY